MPNERGNLGRAAHTAFDAIAVAGDLLSGRCLITEVTRSLAFRSWPQGQFGEREFSMTNVRLGLSRAQILAFRQRVGGLEERLPLGEKSLRRAAWAGLQDSMPRAALLSIHARVNGTKATTWEHPSLVQIWGPRYSAYVVPKKDLAVFTLGRLPEGARARARAHDAASRMRAFFKGQRLAFEEAGRSMGGNPNSLRYAAPTGTILMRWDGARSPVLWTVPAPDIDSHEARLELARRYLHVFGPATALSFSRWAGISTAEAKKAVTALGSEVMTVRAPIGEALILVRDEEEFRAKSKPAGSVRLLPSGDAYYLLWGADRELLVPAVKQRAALWTSRVWPGALFVRGEIVGVWRRAAHEIDIELWRKLSAAEREAVEAEATALPLPGIKGAITVRFQG